MKRHQRAGDTPHGYRDRPGVWRRFAALVPLLLFAPIEALAVGAPLFTTEAPAQVAGGGIAPGLADGDPAEIPRSRITRVNHDELAALRESVASGRASSLRLNLFHDVEFEATIERSAPTSSGYSLSGPLAGVPFGRVVLVVNGDYTAGRVYTPEGNYAIRTTGGLQTVERMDPEPWRCATREPDLEESGAGMPYAAGPDPGAGGLEPKRAEPMVFKRSGDESPGQGLSFRRSGTGGSDEVVVDVLVVYPSYVREIEGGYEQLLGIIDLDIATANEAYAASGVALRIELAAAPVEVDYERFLEGRLSGEPVLHLWRDALRDLAGKDDSHMDEVHALRERHAADLVLMHLGGEIHEEVGRYGIAGIAYGIFDVSAESLEGLGFSVARSGEGTVVAHEIGHSMGLLHDRYDDVGNEPFPYSHGFLYMHAVTRTDGTKTEPRRFGTIMSQYSNSRARGYVLAFSDPTGVTRTTRT